MKLRHTQGAPLGAASLMLDVEGWLDVAMSDIGLLPGLDGLLARRSGLPEHYHGRADRD